MYTPYNVNTYSTYSKRHWDDHVFTYSRIHVFTYSQYIPNDPGMTTRIRIQLDPYSYSRLHYTQYRGSHSAQASTARRTHREQHFASRWTLCAGVQRAACDACASLSSHEVWKGTAGHETRPSSELESNTTTTYTLTRTVYTSPHWDVIPYGLMSSHDGC